MTFPEPPSVAERCFSYLTYLKILWTKNEKKEEKKSTLWPIEEDEDMDMHRMMRLCMKDNRLFAQLPDETENVPVIIRIGTEDVDEPNFAIATEAGTVLTQLSLVNPAYYPDEDTCPYSMELNGLTDLNEYVWGIFHDMIFMWNRLHPDNQLDMDIPIPNYRFLGSEAYLKSKKHNKGNQLESGQ